MIWLSSVMEHSGKVLGESKCFLGDGNFSPHRDSFFIHSFHHLPGWSLHSAYPLHHRICRDIWVWQGRLRIECYYSTSSSQKELVTIILISTERIYLKLCPNTEICKSWVRVLFSLPTQTIFFSFIYFIFRVYVTLTLVKIISNTRSSEIWWISIFYISLKNKVILNPSVNIMNLLWSDFLIIKLKLNTCDR